MRLLPNQGLELPAPFGVSGPGYRANAVHFDGSTWAKIAALASADSPLVTVSGWFLLAAGSATNFVTLGDLSPVDTAAGIWVDPTNSGSYHGHINAAAIKDGTHSNYSYSATVFPFGSSWHHVQFAANGGTLPSQTLLLDGVNIQTSVQDVGNPFNALINGQEFAFPDDITASTYALVAMDAADCMFYFGRNITDPTVFRDPITGKPKDPAGFPQGAIMLSGGASAFFNNSLGTEGPLALQAGTLTNAATSPSD